MQPMAHILKIIEMISVIFLRISLFLNLAAEKICDKLNNELNNGGMILIEIMQMQKKHLEEVQALYEAAYHKEQMVVHALPDYEMIKSFSIKRLEALYELHQGLVALHDGQVVGNFMSVLGDQVFGKSKCAFVPLYGHAVVDTNKNNIYQSLFNQATKQWGGKSSINLDY